MRFFFLLTLIVCAAIGLFLPNTDRVFPFLLYRSLITHSALMRSWAISASGARRLSGSALQSLNCVSPWPSI